MESQPNNRFEWTPQPRAAKVVDELLRQCGTRLAFIQAWQQRLQTATGTRLIDWTDHVRVPETAAEPAVLRDTGFQPDAENVWRHPAGLFPPIVHGPGPWQLVLKVDSVDAFIAANLLAESTECEGEPGSSFRRAMVAENSDAQLWVCERHADLGFSVEAATQTPVDELARRRDIFRQRPRPVNADGDAIEATAAIFRSVVATLGTDRACDLFFATEREYWQSRNRAARVQKARQDALGLGWANHDHHTYRCSRAVFAKTIGLFELMGFHCRERFYAGAEAGWGAQVLAHPTTGVVIFADVDLSPDEVAADFAHEPLPRREELGTVGLWCGLHGESLLAAGMHHLECQFDFQQARNQLREAGVESMPPFTDLPYLKQAFTKAEPWDVDPQRIDALERAGQISTQQADQFRREGALGSHLEVLQRDQGYQGFNQSGINDIIRATDPRGGSSS